MIYIGIRHDSPAGIVLIRRRAEPSVVVAAGRDRSGTDIAVIDSKLKCSVCTDIYKQTYRPFIKGICSLKIGCAAFSGQDVVSLIHKLKGRLSHIHLKDIAAMPTDGSITTRAYLRPIYEGKQDYDSYIKAIAEVGTEHMLVEQDVSYGEDPFECLRGSYENVTKRFQEVK